MKNKTHIVVIGILLVLFFGLMFLSTSNKNVSINYEFEDSVELNSLKGYGETNPIGKVLVENSGFLPSKIKLNNYVLCQLPDTFGDESYQLGYRGDYDRENQAFFDYYNSNVVELSSKESRTLNVVPSIYSWNLRNEILENNLNGETLPFYIFEIEVGENYYDYCIGKNKDDAFKTIQVTLNINESELKNEYY